MKNKKCISAEETAVFCHQVLLFLQAGLSLEEGIVALCESMRKESKYFRKIETKVIDSGNLHSALNEAGIFPEYMVDMVRIGEETGNLEKTLEALINFYEKESKLYTMIHRAIYYPVQLMIIMIIIIGLTVKYILPVFRQLFYNIGMQLSDADKEIVNIGFTVGGITTAVGISLILLLIVLYLISRTSSGRNYIRKLIIGFPFLKKIGYDMEIGRFFESLAMLLNDNDDINTSVKKAGEIVKEKKIQLKVKKCIEMIENGESLDKALEEADLLTNLHRRMIKMGIFTGKLSTVSEKIASIYLERAEENIERNAAAAEPVIMAVLSLITGVIILSVMLPLINIIINL